MGQSINAVNGICGAFLKPLRRRNDPHPGEEWESSLWFWQVDQRMEKREKFCWIGSSSLLLLRPSKDRYDLPEIKTSDELRNIIEPELLYTFDQHHLIAADQSSSKSHFSVMGTRVSIYIYVYLYIYIGIFEKDFLQNNA